MKRINRDKFHCRLVSQSFGCNAWEDFTIDNILYSARIPFEQADALLALYDPSEEILRFCGPKLWFTSEPSWHAHFKKHPVGCRLVKKLKLEERAWYGSAMPSMRVPHYTHNDSLGTPRAPTRRNTAVACVTNFGGRLWFTRQYFRRRNHFILNHRVELYGKPETWRGFRHFPRFWELGVPKNFRGAPLPSTSSPVADELIHFLSGFKVAVCLENRTEPFYFTEKFVNAVRAGCIPVYHAEASVKERFLNGAKWVDPADFGFSAERTLEYALSAKLPEYQAANDIWLKSGALEETDSSKLFKRLHGIIKWKLGISVE